MKQDKGQASRPPLCPVTSARSAGSSERFPGGRNWGQIQKEKMILRSHSPNAYCHKKKIGVIPRKGAYFEPKREVCLLPDAGEESTPGTTVSGGRKPQSHCFYRKRRGLLPGLPQRQQCRTIPPYFPQVLSGRAAGTVGGPAVLAHIQTGGGAGHGIQSGSFQTRSARSGPCVPMPLTST